MTKVLESPILEFIFNTDYQNGLQLYAKLKTPTPEDDRWAGYCLLELGQPWAARDLLTEAMDRGCQAAMIELALTYHRLGEIEIGLNLLERLNLKQLRPFDCAQASRSLGNMYLIAGHHAQALTAFEKAWEIATKDEFCAPLRAGTSHQLGYVNIQLGKLDQAFHHLEYSLEHAIPGKRIYPLLSRAHAYTNAGRFQEAQRDIFEARELLQLTPGMATMITYRLGMLRQMQGHWSEAINLQLETASLAKSRGEREIEFFAEIALIATHTALGQIDQARGHLGRAAHIVHSPREEAFLAMREGTLMTAREQPQAIERLERAINGFQTLGLHRETGWANMHLTEAHLKFGNTHTAHETLERAAAERYALGPSTGVVCELRFLPLTFDHLSTLPLEAYSSVLLQDWRAFEGSTAARVHLCTFGDSRVIADGRPVKLALKRTTEVIAFLLLNPNVTREKIFAALWPDDAPITAANYLHQARLELARAVPGLLIAFDKPEKTYSVQCQGPKLTWDVLEVKRLLTSERDDALQHVLTHYKGPFLPQADNDWVRDERTRLERTLINTALKTMDRWQSGGKSQRCLETARRLLEVEPLNPDLIEHVINSVLVLDGSAAARRELALFAKIFQEELGELPPQLRQVDRALRAKTH
jgi:DNA-binding SARP family transcriptional activator/Tfp pilus assembly protein PilF